MRKSLYTLVLYLFFTNFSFCQEPTSFFNDYHKFSFQFGVSRYTGAETTPLPNTLRYTFRNYTSPHLGFYYDIAQTKNFNLKIGISTLLVRDFQEEFIADEETVLDGDYNVYTEIIGGTLDNWRLNLPITAEYIKDFGFGKLTINSSLILGFHEEFGSSFSSFGVIDRESGDETLILQSTYNRPAAPWYLNGQVGVGMYFPFKGWMLRTNVYYNMAFQKLYEGEFEFTNLEQSPDQSGKFSFNGNSFGIEFSIYLANKKKIKD
uniref:hypothetical protein n=1 Tax=Gelidibacter sp. TaxID=2018083 RepID=UPI004049C77D